MPNVPVVNMQGEQVEDITLSDAVFGIEPNVDVMHMAVVNYLANQRHGTQSTLTRSEVSGGGRKPWRQKGTGHARQGSTRAPQWRHGGVALGPKPRDYSYSLNKKMRRLALKSAFSDKAKNGNVIVLDSLELNAYKTKIVVNCMKAIGARAKSLLVLDNNNPYTIRSASNIAGLKTAQVNTVNTFDILNADTLILVKGALLKIEEVYA